jgi:hypothetical protein
MTLGMKLAIAVWLVIAALSAAAVPAGWPAVQGTRAGSAGAKGTWGFESQPGSFAWTGTRGDRGSFGMFCNVRLAACAWILTLRETACETGRPYPVLVNGPESASPHLLQCMEGRGAAGAVFAFADFGAIDFTVRHSARIAIAIPQQRDAMGIVRFELAGAAQAVGRMRAHALSEIRRPPSASTLKVRGQAGDEPYVVSS